MFVHSISMRVFSVFPDKPPSPRRLGGQVGAQTFIKLPLSDSQKQVKCSSQSQHVSALWLLRISLPRRPGQRSRHDPGKTRDQGPGGKRETDGRITRLGRQNAMDWDNAWRGQRRKREAVSGQKSESKEGGRENMMVHVTLAQPLQAVT